jgi:hypothetical protein
VAALEVGELVCTEWTSGVLHALAKYSTANMSDWHIYQGAVVTWGNESFTTECTHWISLNTFQGCSIATSSMYLAPGQCIPPYLIHFSCSK